MSVATPPDGIRSASDAATRSAPEAAIRNASEAGWRPLFWSAFKRSRNAMAVLDDQRRHVEVNGAYLQLFGYPRAVLIGHPVYEFVIGGPMSNQRWKALLQEPQFTGVVDVRRQDGGRVTVEYAGHPAFVAGKQLVLGVVLRADRRGRKVAPGASSSSEMLKLTKRELDVVSLIALGATGPEIADELQVTHNTVRTHARNAMTKLGARSRAHMVAKALAEVLHRHDHA